MKLYQRITQNLRKEVNIKDMGHLGTQIDMTRKEPSTYYS
jgi:hypothetical protein